MCCSGSDGARPVAQAESRMVKKVMRPPWVSRRALAGSHQRLERRVAEKSARIFAYTRGWSSARGLDSTVSAVAGPECAAVRKRNGPNEKAGCDDPACEK